MRVVETFSGIGSQSKALKNANISHKIVATVEWDINAIYAYDIIHNGKQVYSHHDSLSKSELIDKLATFTLSGNGKSPLEKNSFKVMSADSLRNILYAIERTRNLVSITDVSASDLPPNIDLLTYSFPCQDLSICGSWHGNMSGINRGANNRSGMLWEVERILGEYVDQNLKLPKFLLMENVSNILSETHRHNFQEWKDYLESIGYYNKVYTLNAMNFGLPQSRVRTYMISILSNGEKKIELDNYFDNNDLADVSEQLRPLINYFRIDYSQEKYKHEADISNPNNTPSRKKIFNENTILYGREESPISVKTITTKQDRNPNSGLLLYNSDNPKKAPYRNLTPRECFLLMGFDENDFQSLMDNNIEMKKNYKFFTREKLIKLAGNSIAVPVLEYIFKQIDYIRNNILD